MCHTSYRFIPISHLLIMLNKLRFFLYKKWRSVIILILFFLHTFEVCGKNQICYFMKNKLHLHSHITEVILCIGNTQVFKIIYYLILLILPHCCYFSSFFFTIYHQFVCLLFFLFLFLAVKCLFFKHVFEVPNYCCSVVTMAGQRKVVNKLFFLLQISLLV